MIKIIDDFLHPKEFEEIKTFMESKNFPWFFNTAKVHDDDGKFQYTHLFYKCANANQKIVQSSDFLDMWNNYMRRLESTKSYRIKANMTLKTPSHDISDWHIDNQGDGVNDALMTSLFYVNTNDGYTEFENGVIVGSVANRACIFDSTLKHRGVGHTSPDHHRIVVNFNYS